MSQIALAGDSVYVNTSSLRYRTSAQIKDNNIAGNLSYGQKLERVGTSGQWTMILLNGKKYYVSSAYVTSKKPASAGAVQTTSQTAAGAQTSGGTAIALSSNYKYANYSKINSGTATLYRSTASNKKNKVVCVNAGHGTNGGGRVKTQCHPDGSAKVTGGTTGAGATSAVAVSSGMTFADGTAESKVTLAMAKVLKTKLLNAGYDVLMIRESDDVQLDNIARTVIANNNADCLFHERSKQCNLPCDGAGCLSLEAAQPTGRVADQRLKERGCEDLFQRQHGDGFDPDFLFNDSECGY